MKSVQLIQTCLLLALSTLNLQTSTAFAQPVPKISAGSDGYHSLLLQSDGSLWVTGNNYYGQLGDGTYNNTNRPEQIVASNVTAIAGGMLHSLFLKSDGGLWAMGNNYYGALGDGTYNHTYRPKQIVASGVTAVAGGWYFSLFLKSDSSLWAMGDNYYGQLGDGTYSQTNRPERIVASGVTAIAAGYGHGLFLKSDGSLWGMGYNGQGQLGDGSSYWGTNHPKQIVSSNVTAIAAAWRQSLFLKSDGSLWGMGNNDSGQLGDGTYNQSYWPEQIVASNVTAIAGGGQHSLFLKNDGSLWAMGDNANGQLGDGTYSNTNRPEQIVGSNVTAIAAGAQHSLFLRSDGSLWAMGGNGYGQLGDGTYVQTNRPEQIVAGRPGYKYTFTTLAGVAGAYGRTDGTGSQARFQLPYGVAVDSAGNVYVADTDNHTIRKIAPVGVVSTLAGRARIAGGADGTGTNALFYSPHGVAVDSAGIVYVADTVNHTIRRVTPGGVVSTLAGRAESGGSADGTGSNARFWDPYGVAVDSAGNVYVADTFNETIRKITPVGVVSTLAGLARTRGSADGTGSNARFNDPYGVAVDSAGTLYVSDAYNHTIRKITPGGVVSTLAGLAGARGSADGTGSSARFDFPTAVAVDGAGNLYVAEFSNCTVRKITPGGLVSTLAGLAKSSGSADGTGSNARFNYPYGVAADNTGNIYVADTFSYTIRFGRVAPAPPLLRISPSSGQLILSWPLEASNFVVEASSTQFPAPSWMPLTNAVETDGKSWVLTNGLETGARLFRLRLP